MALGRKGSFWVEGESIAYIDENGEKQSAPLSTIEKNSLKNREKARGLEVEGVGPYTISVSDENTEVDDVTRIFLGGDLSAYTDQGDVSISDEQFQEFDSVVWEDSFDDGSIDSMWTQESGIWEESGGHVYKARTQSDSPGKKLWATAVGRVNSSPTVVGGVVYVGSNDNKVYALDATDGTEEWSFTTGDIVKASPTVANGTVYAGSHDNNVYAIDATHGTKRWSYSTGDIVVSSPTVANGTVFFGSNDGNVYALDADNGSEEWVFGGDAPVRSSSPTVVNGTVYICSGNLYALDASSGTEEWSRTTNSSIDSSPTVADGTVYVSFYDENLYALDASNGSEKWVFNSKQIIRSSPTVADGTVYFGSNEAMYALDASDGTKQWKNTDAKDFDSTPTVANGMVYAGGRRKFFCFDALDGTERLRDGDITWSPPPTVSNGTFYVRSYYHSGNSDGVSAHQAFGDNANSTGTRNLHGTLGHNDLFVPDGSTQSGRIGEGLFVFRNTQYTNDSTGLWSFGTRRKDDFYTNRTVLCNVDGDTGEDFSGYSLVHRGREDSYRVDFERVDDGTPTVLLEVIGGPIGSSPPPSWDVARRPGGEWECYMDGDLQGMVTDDTYDVDGSYVELRAEAIGASQAVQWDSFSYRVDSQ